MTPTSAAATVLRRAVCATTPFGELLVHPDDEFITPALVGGGLWDPSETAWLSWRLRPGMTFVDVGAHVGYFSVMASRRVGAAGRVLAFEPEPGNFALLEENLRRNGCTNATAHAAAVGARGGTVELHLAAATRGTTASTRVRTSAGRSRCRRWPSTTSPSWRRGPTW